MRCLMNDEMANGADPDQTSLGAVCFVSALFAQACLLYIQITIA